MKKKIYLLILTVILFIPTFTYPIKKQQPEVRFEDTKIEPKSNSSSVPFIYGTTRTPYTIDPVDCWDSRSEKLIDQVAETLFTYNYSDPDLWLIPLLATGVSDISGGGLNYTIDLRENVTFHDGTEFNATAAKWNFDRMGYWWNLTGDLPPAEIEGYPSSLFYFEDGKKPIWNHTEIVGEYSIKFVLNAPFVLLPDLLTYTATAMVSPTSHGWDITSPISTGFSKLPVGTGPFVIDYYILNTEAKFHAYENYWREIANISELIFSYYDDSTQLTLDLLGGKVHLIDQIPLSMLDDLTSDPNITVLDEGKTEAIPIYFTFNNHFINQQLRQALSYAINYTFIIEQLFPYTSKRLKSPVPEGILYSNYGFNNPDCNITEARLKMQALDPATFGALDINNDTEWISLANTWTETNWHSGPTPYYLKMWVYVKNSLYFTMADLMGEWAELIGVKIVPEITDWIYYMTQWTIDPDWLDIWLLAWVGEYNDPSRFLNPLLSNATSGTEWAMNGQVNDPYLQNLMDQGLMETDPASREWIYDEIQRYLVEELMPYAWLWNEKLYHAHHVGLTRFIQNVFNRYYFYDYKWAPPFTCEIEILSSGDVSFVKGTTGNIINWTISSDYLINATYNIYVNNIFNTTGSWEIDETVIINLDDLPVGTYEYKIEVFNSNKTAEDVVNVNVQPFIFEITHPSDINYDKGDTGNVILWTVTSNLISNPNYSIYVDDALNRTGFWETGEPIAISVDGLSVGTYEYLIEVNNFNDTIQDIVMVTVEIPTGPEPEIPGYSFLFLVGISVITIHYIRRKLKKKLN